MNRRLQEERDKAQAVLQYANQQQNFNLSDLRSDKTQYFESPYSNRSKSPFKPSEMSARSTINQMSSKKAFSDIDFDEIMQTTTSAAVRSKYRESIATGRLSSYPRTADMSMRSSVSSNAAAAKGNDFWDNAKVAPNGFTSKNCSVSSDNFKPSEEMAEQMQQDEIEQELEYATIPQINKTKSNETNWEERQSMRKEEMSFGQYANFYYQGNNIRDIYSAKSPAKDRKRVALIEVSNMETSADSSQLNTNQLQKIIKSYDTPKAQEMLNNFGKKVNQVHQAAKEKPDLAISGISAMINSMNFDKIAQLSMEPERLRAEKENDFEIPTPSPNYLTPNDALRRDRNAIQGRGMKRRSSSACNETPKTTLDKCMRSKSPSQQKELKAVAATLLKPKLKDDVFKVPHSSHNIRPNLSSFNHSPSSSRQSQDDVTKSPSNREYLTANSMMSSEKLSLPNYGLTRPEMNFSSPTSNGSHLSPNGSPQEGLLKRTVSQLSNGSEFHDDVLPIRIKKSQSKLSWESVKLYSTVTRSISIQNGSSKRLHLRVRVEGNGFSVSPREEFRMISLEARTLEVNFSPTVVGAARGNLIFELVANSKCMRKIPLFAYGGHASMRVEGVHKAPIGPSFITLGLMKHLNSTLEQQFSVTNYGTLPGFAKLLFEKTKWSDFNLSDSFELTPQQVRLSPGESERITVRFKATRDEIRKIIALNKEVAIVGELCMISGDEPTRIRVLSSDALPRQFIDYLPKRVADEMTFKRELVLFNEGLDKTKLSRIMGQLKTNEVALTVSRNMDDTLISADLSMIDDSAMNFETFCETNTNQTLVDVPDDYCHDDENSYFFESKFFKVTPAKIVFSRKTDKPNEPKRIVVESTCDEKLFAEAVSSKHEFVNAIKSCGVISPFGKVEINVIPRHKAFTHRTYEPIHVSVLIGNAKVEVPVTFID